MTRFLSLFLALSLTGCENKVCTEMGCVGGLTLVFKTEDGAPILDASGLITINGVEHPFDCAADPNFQQEITCVDNTIFFATEEAENVEIEVTNGDFSMGWEDIVTPEYEEVFPNGEDCPAECKSATIEIILHVV